MHRLFAAALLLYAGCGCDHGVFGDPFPIKVDTSTGPVIAHVREGDGTVRTAVIDVLAPLTLLDAPDDAPPSRRCTDLTLLGGGPPSDPTALVPRAHLDLTITAMHACPDGAPCRVGTGDEAATTAIDAVIGGDAFDPGAVRFDFTAGEMSLFSEVAGDDDTRGRLCEAQIQRPFRGGGTLFLGGTEVSFPKRRIAFGACLSYEDRDAADGDVAERGADVELVLSTGIGPTILAASAYERWRVASGEDDATTAVTALPAGTVWLPSGPLAGAVGTIDRLALVGRDDDDRGPCRQVYAHHLLSVRDCGAAEGGHCPCTDATRCSVPGVLELAPAARIEVLIVPDDDPTLQALRAELRPGTAEIDGILGTSALAPTSLDIEYEASHQRLLLRCEAAGCTSRPALTTADDRGLIDDCLARAAQLGADAGVP